MWGWQGHMQQLFQRSGSRGPDTGNHRKLGAVSIQQVMQTAKSRTDSARSDGADAWQGPHDVHLLFRLSRPAPSCRGTVSRLLNTTMYFSDLAAFCYRIDQVRRISGSATG